MFSDFTPMSDGEISFENSDLNDGFGPVAGFKNVYVGRQSLNVSNTKRQQIVNIQNCLMNQVDHNIDHVDEQFPDSVFRPTQINAQNFAQIDSIMKLPNFNHEYLPFMPVELENQFNFRFTRFSTPSFDPVWTILPTTKIGVYQISASQDLDQSDGKFTIFDTAPDSIAQTFKRLKGNGKLRGLLLTHEKNEMNTLMLHDFFQNPFSLIPVMNYFHSQQQNVFVPFMADLTCIVKGQNTDDMVTNMGQQLYQFVKHAFGLNSIYQSIAQGSSALMAMHLQHMDLNCAKAIIMNPLIRMRVVQPKQEKAQVKVEKPKAPDEEISAYSTSHSSLRDHTLTDGSIKSETDEIGAPKHQPNNVQIQIRMRPSKPHFSEDIPRPESVNQLEKKILMKSYKLKKHDFQYSDTLTVECNEIVGPSFNEMVTNPVEGYLFYMVNDCLKAIYQDLNVLQTILNILQIKKLKDLHIQTTLQHFIQLYDKHTFETSRRTTFYSSLLSLHAFDPLEAFIGYNVYKDTFDNYFFEMLAEMDFYVQPQTYDFDGPQNIMFLIGSNSCMMSKQQMIDVLEVNEAYLTVEARTVLAAGQEMFFTCAVLLNKILKANG